MPDFHAPFTREELEGRGWTVTDRCVQQYLYPLEIFIYECSMYIYYENNCLKMSVKSFPDALAAAEALLKGVG